MRPLEILEIEEEGQGLVEYALILLLVALAVITGLGLMGDGVIDMFERVSEGFP